MSEPAPESIAPAAQPEAEDEAPPELTVQSRGIDTNQDDKGKEYIVYEYGVYIGRERVHTIAGRFSELHKQHAGLPRIVASKVVFPSKEAGLLGAKNMTSDNSNINARSRELREFYHGLLADNEGQMLTDGRDDLQKDLHKKIGMNEEGAQANPMLECNSTHLF